jgi:hypothetical protein
MAHNLFAAPVIATISSSSSIYTEEKVLKVVAESLAIIYSHQLVVI